MNQLPEIKRLLKTIQASPSPYHTVKEAETQLSEAGFLPLSLETAVWSLQAGGNYFINAYGTTLIAFSIHKEFSSEDSFRIAASHTDWPGLRIKPTPEVITGKYGKLNVEVYGGPILNTWMDRPLSIAGKVVLKGKTPFQPETRLVDFKRPLLTIPNLAIHMNREVNKGVELNPQIDMLPLISSIQAELENEQFFLTVLSKELDTDISNILDFELLLYNTEEGCCFGINEEFLSAPRLDNITSVQACLTGLLETHRNTGIDMIVLFDNEEIGNLTKQGAASALLSNVLERICLELNMDRSAHLAMLSRSIFLSMDVAHALHPNKPEKNDITNKIHLNDGFAIKMNSRQAYATDSNAIAIIEGICQKNLIPYKKFVNRSDVTGGLTLASVVSAQLAMKAVDVGIPLLAMHSARETMGIYDQKVLVDLCRAFFTEE